MAIKLQGYVFKDDGTAVVEQQYKPMIVLMVQQKGLQLQLTQMVSGLMMI